MVWLRGPRANRPGELSLLNAVLLHIKILRSQKRHTDNAWDYDSLPISVKAGKSVYEIPDPRFGRPLAVLTIDPANPNHIQRRIPFYSPQNLAFNWGWPMNIGAWIVNYDGSVHSAERVAFYWKSGVPYLEFQPIPFLPCTYLLQFSVGDAVDVMELTEEVTLGEVGNSLVEIRASRSLLPSSAWEDDEKLNEARRKEIGTTLTMDETLLAKQFEAEALVNDGTTIGRQWSPLDAW